MRYTDNDKSFLESFLGGKFTDKVHVLSYSKQGSLGIVAFDNTTEHSTNIYLAGVGPWVSRAVLNNFLTFAFDTLSVKRIVAYIDPDNEKSIKFATQLGFVKECTLRGLGLYQYSLTKQDSKYYGLYK